MLNEDGSFTGEVKRRADVHRDGDWHRAFHLWVVSGTSVGEGRVLFQRRSPGKDTWPNHLDVAVGGHYRAGETVSDVIREIDEEIGIQPDLSELVFAGRRRAISQRPEWYDRELQDLYVLAIRGEFPQFKPNGVEIAGLAQVSISELIRLFGAEISTVPASMASVVADRRLGAWRGMRISASDFVPVGDNYWVRGALACQALLAGASAVSIERT